MKLDYLDLIGLPWEWDGCGEPGGYDCYGLLQEIHRRLGVEIPNFRRPGDRAQIAAIMSTNMSPWRECEQGAGASVLIRLARTLHVGYMVDDIRMIHVWEQSGGVVVERVEPWQPKILGFYRYVGLPE
ncbi:NlpC/P60 family protein [Cupriavidus campinensis]|uniref:NlpC/P60 family protein n=1 Tax=Cupriavidus campinensis TaxID=151783 RepID=UPI001642BE93|nr:NlpC/P60 family protein [Cupriavidus campinensis]